MSLEQDSIQLHLRRKVSLSTFYDPPVPLLLVCLFQKFTNASPSTVIVTFLLRYLSCEALQLAALLFSKNTVSPQARKKTTKNNTNNELPFSFGFSDLKKGETE